MNNSENELKFKLYQICVESVVPLETTINMPGNIVRRKITYTQEDLESALTCLRNKTMSIRKASVMYKIPKSTLSDRITGKR